MVSNFLFASSFFSRIIIAKHHSRIVSEIGSFVRELPASAVELEHNSADDRETQWLFANQCLGPVNGDAATRQYDGAGSATSLARHLLRFKLRAKAAGSSYH